MLRTILVLGSLAAALSGQGEVRILSFLGEGVEPLVQRSVAAACPDVTVVWRRGSHAEFGVSARHVRPDADLVVGLDGLYAADLARLGHLATSPEIAATPVQAPYRGSEDRFAVPWLTPIVLVYDPRVWTADTAPDSFDELVFLGEYRDRIMLCEPEAMPSMWAGWRDMHRALGRSAKAVTSWFRTLDVQVRGYYPSESDVLDALSQQRGSLSVLPAAALGADSTLSLRTATEGAPAMGLAVARVTGADPGTTGPVLAHLLSSGLAVAIASDAVIPAPRSDLSLAQLPEPVQRAYETLFPYDDTRGQLTELFGSWRESVRDQGKWLESIDFWLEAAFTLGFLIFLYVLYTRMKKEPAT